MRSRTVTVGWAHPETEEEFRVTCSVYLGTPDRGPDFNCAGGYPGDPPEIEVLEVAEDESGALRPDLLDAVERDLGRLEERAFEAAADDDDPYDTIEEARGDR